MTIVFATASAAAAGQSCNVPGDVPTLVMCLNEVAAPEVVRDDAGVALSAYWPRLDDLAIPGLPAGTRQLDIRPVASPPPDLTGLDAGPFPGTRQRQDGPFTIVYADELTLLGRPVGLWCAPSLDPKLADTPAQACNIVGRLSDNLSFQLQVRTYRWVDDPAWPVFDADYASTWPPVLAALDQFFTDTFNFPLQEN